MKKATQETVAEPAQKKQELKTDDLQKVEEIRQKRTTQIDIQPDLKKAVQEARHLTLHEYLNRFGQGELVAEYTVGTSDVLAVTVFEDESLSVDEVRVNSDGLINLPLLGVLEVGGLTPSQIEALVTRRLKEEKYLINPHVGVNVKAYKSQEIVVLGAIKEPGSYNLRKAETLMSILSRAGGVDREVAGNEAILIREKEVNNGTEKFAVHIDLQALLSAGKQTANLPVRNKDTVFIPKAEKFFVIGQVNNPGEFYLTQDTSVVEAISMAGGFTRIAARSRVKVSRLINGEKKILYADIEALTEEGDQEENVFIKANDVVIVPESYF